MDDGNFDDHGDGSSNTLAMTTAMTMSMITVVSDDESDNGFDTEHDVLARLPGLKAR